MHSAPAVSYPAGRSRGAERLLHVGWVMGACCAAAAALLADSFGWRSSLLCVAGLGAAWAARHALQQARQIGEIRFDGQHWSLSGVSSMRAGRAQLALDLQSIVLVRISGAGSEPRWLWLDRASMPERWRDLRRALYSRAPSADPSGDSRPPAPDNADPTRS